MKYSYILIFLYLNIFLVTDGLGALDEREFQQNLPQDTLEFAEFLAQIKPTTDQLSLARQISERNKVEEIFDLELSKKSDFFIFVSFSMKDKNIKQILEDASRYNAVVVLRGLKNNSMKETVQYLAKFLSNTNGGLTIDPELFEKFSVKKVPTFVLFDGKKHDMLSGNVTFRFVLQKFAESGDCSQEAKERSGV